MDQQRPISTRQPYDWRNGQAADVAGLTKRSFAEMLGKYNISIFNSPVSDIAKDVAKA